MNCSLVSPTGTDCEQSGCDIAEPHAWLPLYVCLRNPASCDTVEVVYYGNKKEPIHNF